MVDYALAHSELEVSLVIEGHADHAQRLRLDAGGRAFWERMGQQGEFCEDLCVAAAAAMGGRRVDVISADSPRRFSYVPDKCVRGPLSLSYDKTSKHYSLLHTVNAAAYASHFNFAGARSSRHQPGDDAVRHDFAYNILQDEELGKAIFLGGRGQGVRVGQNTAGDRFNVMGEIFNLSVRLTPAQLTSLISWHGGDSARGLEDSASASDSDVEELHPPWTWALKYGEALKAICRANGFSVLCCDFLTPAHPHTDLNAHTLLMKPSFQVEWSIVDKTRDGKLKRKTEELHFATVRVTCTSITSIPQTYTYHT